MKDVLEPAEDATLSFGSFRLRPSAFLLERDGMPVPLRSRAFAILVALTARPGEVLTNAELHAQVWPNLAVDETTLRVHMSALRRVLGDGRDGARFIKNIPGRGYSFVAAVTRAVIDRVRPRAAADAEEDPGRSLPARRARIVGRDDTIFAIVGRLLEHRFVTIVGPGGIGKTTVAVAVGEALLSSFDRAVYFIDLGPLNTPTLVPGALATVLGLPVQSDDPAPAIVKFLRGRRALIILDCCEHLIEPTALLAEQIFAQAPGAHLLMTSREPLRVEGERVHRLQPMAGPPDDGPLNAAEAANFPAVQLFVERAAASVDGFGLADGDAMLVADICRKLDGIALAIELAAGRVEAFGIRGIASMLDDRFKLLTGGRRTASARHRTLAATLDWSYSLLTDEERAVLRRLSIFVGRFTLDAAQAMVGPEGLAAVSELVAKSLIAMEIDEAPSRCRLLDSTRAYGRQKLTDSGEAQDMARRHADYYLALFSGEIQGAAPHLDNLRAALAWCFSPAGDGAAGVALVAVAAPRLLEASLLTECRGWTERATAALGSVMLEPRLEMELQTAHSISLRYTRGNSDEAYAALTRALELAEQLDDRLYQLRLLEGFYIFQLRVADFKGALGFARRSEAVVEGQGGADWMVGVLDHFMGDQENARRRCAVALQQAPIERRAAILRFGIDQRMLALCANARALWLQGRSDEAMTAARETLAEIEAIRHPVSHCIALAWVAPIALWVGDFETAEAWLALLQELADKHSLVPYHALGLGLNGELLVRRGDVPAGIGLLRAGLDILRQARHLTMNTALELVLAEALGLVGDRDGALRLADEVILRITASGEATYLPEAKRVRGLILRPDIAAARTELTDALAIARAQSAGGWQRRIEAALAG